MPLIGPFFFIDEKLLYAACPLSEGRVQAGKLDYSCSHEELYDAHYSTGDYIDYSRGRVVWDIASQRAILYIDPCIRQERVIRQIKAVFHLEDVVIQSDVHYHCRMCSDAIWNA